MSGQKRIKRSTGIAVLLLTACLLASCAPQKMVDSSASREGERKETSQPASSPVAPPPRQTTAESQATITPPPGQAGVLFAQAQKAMEAGQLDKAELLLERALRLAPRDPRLWHAMARLRFQQRNYSQAVQFCLKSNSLAGKDKALRRQNWLLLEKAYLKMGKKKEADHAGAQAAGQP